MLDNPGPPPPPANEPEALGEADWDVLLRRISGQRCTPILGAGIYSEAVSRIVEVAQEWAQDPEYPFDRFEVSRVTQFLSIKFDATDPKDRLIACLKGLPAPAFENENEPHRILASLPLPVFVTTNYDDFMTQALRKAHKEPRRDFLRWSTFLQREPSVFSSDHKPTVANPSVFHLNGNSDLSESLVLTDDDYLDFLVEISRDEKMIPPHIDKAMTTASLILLGYDLDDWNFRVLFRSIVNFLDRSVVKKHFCVVQLEPATAQAPEHPEGSPEREAARLALQEQKSRARDYFNRYFDRHDVHVYWGTSQNFIKELKERWEKSGYAR